MRYLCIECNNLWSVEERGPPVDTPDGDLCGSCADERGVA